MTTLSGDMQTANALANLAIARGGTLDDPTGLVYLRQLEDLSPDFVERACLRLANEPRGAYETTMPAVGTIRAAVGVLEREARAAEQALKLLPLPARESDEPTYFCTLCFDEPSAWRVFWCAGSPITAHLSADAKRLPIYHCGRTKTHYAHSYTERCECLPTNPVIAAAKAAMANYRPGKQKADR